MTQTDRSKVRAQRFGWSDKEAESLVVEGEPDYPEISLTERVEDRNRGETPQ